MPDRIRKTNKPVGKTLAAKKSSSGWSSGNKTGKTASQLREQKKAVEGPKKSVKPKTYTLKRVSDYYGTEGPKKPAPRSGVGKGGGRGIAMNKPSAKKRGK
jgi:hypothetical protein